MYCLFDRLRFYVYLQPFLDSIVRDVLTDNETVGGCQLNGTAGVRLDKSCYAAFSAAVIPSTTAWSASVVSWFKANGFCQSIGAQLATLDPTLTASNTSKTFVDYLVNVSTTATYWVGLSRNPWLWVEEYDEGKISELVVGPFSYTQPNPTEHYKKLSYCWETVRRESMPRIAEMDVEMTT